MLGLMNKKTEARFDKLDGLIEDLAESVNEQFTTVKSDIEFLKVAKVDKADIEEIVERVAGTKIDKMLSILDDQSKYFQEQEMLKGQVNRHDKWINKIALKTDVKLDY